jgi:RNA polymerase sigma-70 factor (ECF subfamily)
MGTPRRDAQPPDPPIGNVKEFLWQRLLKMAPDDLLTRDFERFYRLHKKVIVGLARRWIPSRHDREDFAQDMWASLLVKLPRLDWDPERGRIRPWLCAFVSHRAIDLLRKKRRCPDREAKSLDEADCVDPSPSLEGADNPYKLELLRALIGELKRRSSGINRRLITLRYVERRPVREVAATLGIPRGAVSNRLNRMLKRLRHELAIYGGEPLLESPDDLLDRLRKKI